MAARFPRGLHCPQENVSRFCNSIVDMGAPHLIMLEDGFVKQENGISGDFQELVLRRSHQWGYDGFAQKVGHHRLQPRGASILSYSPGCSRFGKTPPASAGWSFNFGHFG